MKEQEMDSRGGFRLAHGRLPRTLSGMARTKQPPHTGRYPIAKKIAQWQAEHDRDFQDFATLVGCGYDSLYGWVTRGRQMPAWAVQRIAERTGLPMAYWMNGALPYPPPRALLKSHERIVERLYALSEEQAADVEEMLSKPEDVAQTLEIRRVARRGR